MPLPTAPLPANVIAALQRGNTIDAIKLLRESSGVGLKEAKDAIEQHLRGNSGSVVTAASDGSLPCSVVVAMRRGQKIEAIKLLREQTGLGLKEAKEAVEGYQGKADAAAGQRSPGEVPRSGRFAWVAALVVIALVAYYFLRRSG
jgi:ribosomal protein L7/L12